MAEYSIKKNGGPYRGTHGTSHSCALSIKAIGFNASLESGRVGKGIYFWAYEQYGSLAVSLAKNWWGICNAQNKYQDDVCKKVAVIDVRIDIPEENTLDLDSTQFRESLFNLISQRRLFSNEDKAKAYEIFIDRIETRANKKFDMYKVLVDSPKPITGGGRRLPMAWPTISQSAYIVRNHCRESIAVNFITSECGSTQH